MNDPNKDAFTWRDIQSLARTLAQEHPDEKILTLTPQRLTGLLAVLPGFAPTPSTSDDFILSAIVTAWIDAEEDDDEPFPSHPPA